MRERIFMLCYDVGRDKVRRMIAGRLEREMVRVQDSVFEARLPPARAHQLFAAVEALAEPGDRVRLYAIADADAALARTCGGPPLPEASACWIL